MAKILIVDDDKHTRLLCNLELRDEGYEVATAADAREAVELFRSCRPGLVVLDIRMPGMDGIELLGRMLAIDRRVPILLFTAYSFYRENFLSWAADAFLLKSSDFSELKRCIRGRLGRPPDAPAFGFAGASLLFAESA